MIRCESGLNIYHEGQLRTSTSPLCHHNTGVYLQPLFIENTEYIAVSCYECEKSMLCNSSTLNIVSSYKVPDLYPGAMSLGHPGRMHVEHIATGRKLVIKLDARTRPFRNIFNMQKIFDICYLNHPLLRDALLLTNWETNSIQAINAQTGNIIWNTTGEVDGKICNPHGVVATQTGEVIVADGRNARLIVLDGLTGDVLSTHDLPQCGVAAELHLMNDDSELVLCCDYQKKVIIAYYNIT